MQLLFLLILKLVSHVNTLIINTLINIAKAVAKPTNNQPEIYNNDQEQPNE